MNVIETAANGVVNTQTVFTFSQTNKFVTAKYSGGHVFDGYLVGVLEDEKLSFCYCQLHTDGTKGYGQSECELIVNDAGKIRLIEHFIWGSKPGEAGVNILQEL